MQWDNFMQKTISKHSPENLYKFVLNEKNRLITKDFIKNMMAEYGLKYQPNDIKLYDVAMTHTSYVNYNFSEQENFKKIFSFNESSINENLLPILNESSAQPLRNVSYERLELLGDIVLKLILTDYIFFRFESLDSGDITKLRSCLENRLAFANITRKLNLNRYILLNRNHETMCSRDTNNKMLCDVFESFIGALYLDLIGIKYDEIGVMPDIIDKDRGDAFKIIYKFVIQLLEDNKSGPDLCQIMEIDTNYVTRLQTEFNKLGWGIPIYVTMEVNTETVCLKGGNAIVKTYKIGVKNKMSSKFYGIGISKSKKNAKQDASKNALRNIEEI